MNATRFALSLLLCGAFTSQLHAQRAPRPVEILRRGQGTHGVASPDGSHFAYWASTGFAVFRTESRERIHVEDSRYDPNGCSDIAWSADGTRVAFSHTDGVSEYVLGTRTSRAVHQAPERRSDGYSCNVGYDPSNRVLWLEMAASPYIGREGRTPIPVPFAGYVAFAPTAGVERVVLSAARLSGRPAASPELFVLDLAEEEPVPRTLALIAASFPHIDVQGRRLCVRTSQRQLECINIADGTRRSLGSAHLYASTTSAQPFSPSGEQVLVMRDWHLYAHSFRDGSERRITNLALPGGSIAFQGATFENEASVLLFEHYQRRRRRDPAIVRVSLRSGQRWVLLRDREQLCYLRPSGGSLFGYRTNRSSEDLVRVELETRRARSRRVRLP
ncbi:MAG: hypothetical protein AAF645_08870 [Myxococcota bacterium]